MSIYLYTIVKEFIYIRLNVKNADIICYILMLLVLKNWRNFKNRILISSSNLRNVYDN